MQSERRAAARAWRTSADQDVRIARGLTDVDANVACFHAQQAGEKALKSSCVAALDDVARIQVLTSLLDELRDGGFDAAEDVVAAARTLDRFYAPTRYPDAVGGYRSGAPIRRRRCASSDRRRSNDHRLRG